MIYMLTFCVLMSFISCILIDFMMIKIDLIKLITNRVPISPDLHGM